MSEHKAKFQVSGRILEISEVQTFSSGFTKRTLVVDASQNPEYPNPVQLTLKKDDCSKADSLTVGDSIAAEGFVEGRRWERDGSVRYFTDLSVKSILVTEKAARPTTASDWKSLLALGLAYGESEDAIKSRCKSLGKPFKEMQTADWQKLAAEIVAANGASQEAPAPADDDDIPF